MFESWIFYQEGWEERYTFQYNKWTLKRCFKEALKDTRKYVKGSRFALAYAIRRKGDGVLVATSKEMPPFK